MPIRRPGRARHVRGEESERELVERAKVDPTAFGTLYDHHAAGVYRYVHARLHDREAAEDVTSEVFFKALRSIASYSDQGRPFTAWLYQIAANTVIDHVRARKPNISLEESAEAPSARPPVDDFVMARLDLERVWAAVATLTALQQQALALKLAADLSVAEIAACMGRSEGAVKLLVHRGLGAIRADLGGSTPRGGSA
jgi:RNA polymerase sigma-70 factor (ECF subfamily)